MKKIIILSVLIILFILLLELYPKEKHENYTFYKKENKERYQVYKSINYSLDNEDIILQVNLNLDKPFYQDTKEANLKNPITVLVNKHYYLPEDYVPNNLKVIPKCSISNKYLVQEANFAYQKLCEDATNNGLNIRVISSYRSYNYQKQLYDKYVEKDGVEKADTYSARAGHSEHQTGLVIDVDNISLGFESFENTKEFKWMQDNCYKYGFILRYPKGKENITGYSYEAWHYRYVGVDIATKIKKEGLTLDEYYAKYLDN